MLENQTEIKCPKCGSTQLSANQKGFSGKQAIAGAVLTGGIGILAGTIGSKKINITCLSCGKQFQPGNDLEAVKTKEIARKKQEVKNLKSPGFWIFMIVGMIFFFWLFRGCL